MKKAYKTMMQQQVISHQAAEDFFQKLEQSPVKKPLRLYKKVLIAAACLCILIPTTVLAAENIFDIASIHLSQRKDLNGKDAIGYDIDFGTEKAFPLEVFPDAWQHPQENLSVTYDTWEEAQEDMGLDFLDNTVLASEEFQECAVLRPADHSLQDPKVPCYSFIRSYDGQLYSVSNYVVFLTDGATVSVTTDILVDHPTLPQEVKDVFTSIQMILPEKDLDNYTTEQYTTANGLTATLVTYTFDNAPGHAERFIAFRANGIRYILRTEWYGGDCPLTQQELLLKVLEGFTL